MSEEIENKIRLEQARRDAIRSRIDKSDGISGGMNDNEKLQRREKLYGSGDEKKEEKKESSKFAKVAGTLALAKKAKDIMSAPTEIKAMDVSIYGIAFTLALLKDLLDLAFIGSLPAIGTVITFCISMAIGAILLFDGVSGAQRKIARNLTKRFLVLIAGTMVEGILFGLNFFPFEFFTVGIIYWMALVDRKKETRTING
jgi:hypothetical protein